MVSWTLKPFCRWRNTETLERSHFVAVSNCHRRVFLDTFTQRTTYWYLIQQHFDAKWFSIFQKCSCLLSWQKGCIKDIIHQWFYVRFRRKVIKFTEFSSNERFFQMLQNMKRLLSCWIVIFWLHPSVLSHEHLVDSAMFW